jgi:ABC-type uncharacterized transport system ATPase subunit
VELKTDNSKPFAVEMSGITKLFGNQIANDQIDLDVRVGEIHCLVGENGAGKTTLMNILYGLMHQDEGNIRIFGQLEQIQNPMKASLLGIGMVHQHFKLVESYTVAENVILGKEPRKALFIDRKEALQITRDISEQYGLAVDPGALIRDLAVGVRQRVEILKTLYRGSKIIILDEPTAVLTPQESQALFMTIEHLLEGGKTVIFITHKVKEVMAVADRVTVLRRGKRVGILERGNITEKAITNMMVGREMMLELEKKPKQLNGELLNIKNLTARGDRGNLVVKNVSFNCQRGEILIIAGVEGNGQAELIETITGLRKALQGEIWISGKNVVNHSPAAVRAVGLAHVPADRISIGLCVKEKVSENLIAGKHKSPFFQKGIFLDWKKIQAYAKQVVADFDIRTSGAEELVQNLSGGNMQKVVLARELLFQSDLLVAVSPTRGVDVAAIEAIHQEILKARDSGRAILLVSTDLDEVLQLSDRILVMYNGEITGEFDPKNTTREELGAYMIGARHQDKSIVSTSDGKGSYD